MLRCLSAPLRLGALILLLSGFMLAQVNAQGVSMAEYVFGYSKAVNAVVLSPDGRQAVSASQDNLIRLWDAATGLLLRTFDTQTAGTNAVAFLPDGKRILVAGTDKQLMIWDIAAGRVVTVMDGHTADVMSAMLSADAQQVLSGSKDKTVKLWDTATGLPLKSFDGYPADVLSVALSSDGRLVLAGGADKTLKLWDVETGQLLRSFEGHADAVTSVAFSPDNRKALSASKDKTLKLWDVTSAKVIRTFDAQPDEVLSATFASGGRQILSTGKDAKLRLWDAETGALLKTLEGHADAVSSAALSTDGRLALSGGKDKTVKLWDLEAGQLKSTFDLQTEDFRPNGRRTYGLFGFIPGVALPGAPDAGHMADRLREKGFKTGDPVYLRIFKGDSLVELWMKRGSRFELFSTYPICAWSGQLGPKLQKGDFQSPEGFYTIGKGQLNPNSHYHRAFNLGYPNSFDAANSRTGDALMVHGSCASAGCYAMTDPVIDELWALVTGALNAGQEHVAVHVFPFRMTEERMTAFAWHPWAGFWRDLKPAYDLFEETRVPPQPSVCNKRYAVKRGSPAANGPALQSGCPAGRENGWAPVPARFERGPRP